MQAALNKTALCPPLIDRMIAFVYHESLVFALNKFHYRQVVDILANDLGMDMLQLDLGSEVVQHGPSIAALERIGALYGHGDILFSGVEMMFAKPLSKGGGERMGGHHAVGSSVFQKSSVDGLVNKTDACACVVASSASTACGVAHVTCHGSTRGMRVWGVYTLHTAPNIMYVCHRCSLGKMCEGKAQGHADMQTGRPTHCAARSSATYQTSWSRHY